MKIFYIQNKNQYLSLITKLFPLIDNWNLKEEIGLSGCTYQYDESDEEYLEQYCSDCELEECLLAEHFKDKDVTKRIIPHEKIREYPVIMVITDSDLIDERAIFIPVSEAKANTKFGTE